MTGVLWVAGLTLAAGLIAFLWYRTTVEPSPGFPLQYAPPEGLGPVQMEYIRTESVPKNSLTATLFYLAERGMIELRQVNDEQWNVRGLVDISEWDQVDPVSRKVGIALKVNRPGTEFEAKKTVKSGEKLNKAKTDMAKAVQKWAFDGGLMVKRKQGTVGAHRQCDRIGSWRCADLSAWVSRPLCGACHSRCSSCSPRGRGSAASAPGVPRPGVNCGRGQADSTACWSTDSAETRFEFAARKDLYTAYIPFAVAAGAAALWAKKYQAATGSAAPQPDWYSSSSSTGYWGFAGSSDGARV